MPEFSQFNGRPSVDADAPTRRSYESTELHSAQDNRWIVRTVSNRYGTSPDWRRCSQGKSPVQLQRWNANISCWPIQSQTAASAHHVTSEPGRPGPNQHQHQFRRVHRGPEVDEVGIRWLRWPLFPGPDLERRRQHRAGTHQVARRDRNSDKVFAGTADRTTGRYSSLKTGLEWSASPNYIHSTTSHTGRNYAGTRRERSFESRQNK